MQPSCFHPFPVLDTPRLLLRRALQEDAADIFGMRSDPEVMQYIPRPLAKTVEDIYPLLGMIGTAIEKGEGINWAIEWKATGRVIGLLGYHRMMPEHFRAEVGYSLSRAWHRQGIMREALRAVLEYGFNVLELHSVEAIIDAQNVASGGLLEQMGFTKEAFFREDFYYNGEFRNSIHYGMLRTEFR